MISGAFTKLSSRFGQLQKDRRQLKRQWAMVNDDKILPTGAFFYLSMKHATQSGAFPHRLKHNQAGAIASLYGGMSLGNIDAYQLSLGKASLEDIDRNMNNISQVLTPLDADPDTVQTFQKHIKSLAEDMKSGTQMLFFRVGDMLESLDFASMDHQQIRVTLMAHLQGTTPQVTAYLSDLNALRDWSGMVDKMDGPDRGNKRRKRKPADPRTAPGWRPAVLNGLG